METVSHPLLFIMLIGSITLIEVVPIKINPWSWLFKHIGNMMLGDFKEEMLTFKFEQERRNANDMRWNIINFANGCRRNDKHSKDAWNQVLNQITEYECYVTVKHINNGVIDAESEYLRSLYQEVNKNNNFA